MIRYRTCVTSNLLPSWYNDHMHRETFLAIGIGLGLGLLVAVGFYQFRQVVTPVADRPTTVTPTITQDENQDNNITTIDLTEPPEGTVVSSASINLAGKLNSSVTLMLFSPKSETIIAQPEDNEFATNVQLQAGLNVLTLLAINELGQSESVERLVVYDSTSDEVEINTEDEDEDVVSATGETKDNEGVIDQNTTVTTPTTAPSTTTRALLDRINDKLSPNQAEEPVQTVIDQLRRAYLGQVERVTDEAIRLQTRTQPISLTLEKLTNIRLGEKKIEPNQIEVENWLLVIGALSEPDNLESLIPEKTLVYTKSPRPEPPFASLGSLESLSKSQIQLVERQSGESATLTLASGIRYLDSEGQPTTAANFTSDTGVLVTGYVDGDNRTVTTVRALAPFVKEEVKE